MLRRWSMALAAAVAATALWAPGAWGADPGRWTLTGVSDIPLRYYQGITNDPQRKLYFDGIFIGLYRTNDRLQEEAGTHNVIPPDVFAREHYNHVGDISWDAADGGRILLPLECYYPPAGNTCRTGSIGVADPRTLQMRYYVKLDPAEIPKAMWNEVSPDGQLIWTSSGDDLLAYRASDVAPRNAAPAGPLIKAVRRLRGAVPPVGITGAVFHEGRLFTAGQDGELFQVWSTDLTSGVRRLEIERHLVGEAEGLAVIRAFGGVLHWIVTPYNPEARPPTYGPNDNALLHFVRAARPPIRRTTRLRVSVRPRSTRVRRRTRFLFRVRTVGTRRPVRGALVRFAGRSARTNRRGRAVIVKRFRRSGRYRARARKGRASGRSPWVRVRSAPRFTG